MAYTRHHRELENTKEEFLRRTKQTINDCIRLSATDNLEAETIDSIVLRIERVERNLVRGIGVVLSQEETGPILEETREMLKDFEQLREASGLGHSSYRPGKIRLGRCGAPRYDVSMEQLEFL
ncbi:uncharacterized protein LOC134249274, partial [Saccostrea cucullata]|uniref:uncharacterized protein LOC134249274 n=1 Tax=Saccostrea cuccullata TaxID=36930 RepID=UPI002ED19FDB